MRALSNALAIGGALAALAAGAPAGAQYYPGYGYAYPGNEGVVGVMGGAYGFGPNRQIAINNCANAAQQRLGGYGGGRVLGVSDARAAGDGGVLVRGVATSGRFGNGYGYSYGNPTQPPVDLMWRCRTDYRGFIREVNIDAANSGYGYNSPPWDDDFSRFGYRRY